jgi:two-component system, chemotaxis family, protein-glutamate methylesterase/glutaminase
MHSESSEKIRVLVADDSLFMRTYLVALLRLDPEILIVGTASSGHEVVLLAGELMPDVITMDYHMPRGNGVAATAAIMQGEGPLPAIIMLSAFSGADGEHAKSLLEESGAHVIVKPSGEVSLDIEKIAAEIVKKIKEVGHFQRLARLNDSYVHPDESHSLRSSHDATTPRIVVIGASTGGPPLIEHLVAHLDPSRHSVVIAQHMSKYFTELFAERLNRVTEFEVREAVDGDTLKHGVALVVPGGYALSSRVHQHGVCTFTIEKILDESREVMIDRTMECIARCHHGGVVGVLLSGMGNDGTEGLRAISAGGGLSLVQDPETATVGAMPLHALLGSGSIAMLAIDDIPARISSHFARNTL